MMASGPLPRQQSQSPSGRGHTHSAHPVSSSLLVPPSLGLAMPSLSLSLIGKTESLRGSLNQAQLLTPHLALRRPAPPPASHASQYVSCGAHQLDTMSDSSVSPVWAPQGLAQRRALEYLVSE